MDNSYDISLNKLNTEGMMEETEILMSLIFRDFLCSEELNQKLIEYDNNQIKKELERYNTSSLSFFKNWMDGCGRKAPFNLWGCNLWPWFWALAHCLREGWSDAHNHLWVGRNAGGGRLDNEGLLRVLVLKTERNIYMNRLLLFKRSSRRVKLTPPWLPTKPLFFIFAAIALQTDFLSYPKRKRFLLRIFAIMRRRLPLFPRCFRW